MFKVKKARERKLGVEKARNPYLVDGKDMSQVPIYYLEGDYDLTPTQEKALWQYGVDTGIVWQLQGWYGRTAQAMLSDGYLHYPIKHKKVAIGLDSSTDFYGNPIPTHEQAKKLKLYKK